MDAPMEDTGPDDACGPRGYSGNTKWEVQSAKWRGSLEIPPEHHPWTTCCSSRTRKMTKRTRDLVDCSANAAMETSKVAASLGVRTEAACGVAGRHC